MTKLGGILVSKGEGWKVLVLGLFKVMLRRGGGVLNKRFCFFYIGFFYVCVVVVLLFVESIKTVEIILSKPTSPSFTNISFHLSHHSISFHKNPSSPHPSTL